MLGYSALEAGIRMLPMACVMLVVAPLAPRLVERVGTKLVVGAGLLLVTAGHGMGVAGPRHATAIRTSGRDGHARRAAWAW